MTLAEPPDISQGWCCDGRTWKEHADADGHCCQPEGRQLEELPEDGQQRQSSDWGEVADRWVPAR